MHFYIMHLNCSAFQKYIFVYLLLHVLFPILPRCICFYLNVTPSRCPCPISTPTPVSFYIFHRPHPEFIYFSYLATFSLQTSVTETY